MYPYKYNLILFEDNYEESLQLFIKNYTDNVDINIINYCCDFLIVNNFSIISQLSVAFFISKYGTSKSIYKINKKIYKQYGIKLNILNDLYFWFYKRKYNIHKLMQILYQFQIPFPLYKISILLDNIPMHLRNNNVAQIYLMNFDAKRLGLFVHYHKKQYTMLHVKHLLLCNYSIDNIIKKFISKNVNNETIKLLKSRFNTPKPTNNISLKRKILMFINNKRNKYTYDPIKEIITFINQNPKYINMRIKSIFRLCHPNLAKIDCLGCEKYFLRISILFSKFICLLKDRYKYPIYSLAYIKGDQNSILYQDRILIISTNSVSDFIMWFWSAIYYAQIEHNNGSNIDNIDFLLDNRILPIIKQLFPQSKLYPLNKEYNCHDNQNIIKKYLKTYFVEQKDLLQKTSLQQKLISAYKKQLIDQNLEFNHFFKKKINIGYCSASLLTNNYKRNMYYFDPNIIYDLDYNQQDTQIHYLQKEKFLKKKDEIIYIHDYFDSKNDFDQLFAYISQLNYYIGVATLPMQIARFLDIPVYNISCSIYGDKEIEFWNKYKS